MVVRPIVAQRASVKDNSTHMPCILDPTTFSYSLNDRGSAADTSNRASGASLQESG